MSSIYVHKFIAKLTAFYFRHVLSYELCHCAFGRCADLHFRGFSKHPTFCGSVLINREQRDAFKNRIFPLSMP